MLFRRVAIYQIKGWLLTGYVPGRYFFRERPGRFFSSRLFLVLPAPVFRRSQRAGQGRTIFSYGDFWLKKKAETDKGLAADCKGKQCQIVAY